MKFSIGQVVGAALTSFGKEWGRLIVGGLFFFFSLYISAKALPLLPKAVKIFSLPFVIILIALACWLLFSVGLYLGWAAFILAVARGERPEFRMLWTQLFTLRPLYALGAALLAGFSVVAIFILSFVPGYIILSRWICLPLLIVTCPSHLLKEAPLSYFIGPCVCFLLIIPTLIALARCSMIRFPIIEHGAGPLGSLSESNRLVRGATGRVLAICFLSWLFCLIPIIGPIINELILTHLYLALKPERESASLVAQQTL